jgi:hypothetical protein
LLSRLREAAGGTSDSHNARRSSYEPRFFVAFGARTGTLKFGPYGVPLFPGFGFGFGPGLIMNRTGGRRLSFFGMSQRLVVDKRFCE